MSDTIILGATAIAALRGLLDYVYDDEEEDFETCEGGGGGNHIFLSIQALSNALDRSGDANDGITSRRLRLAAPELLDALEQAIQALNTAPSFRVPHLDTDSYKIASICDLAIAKAKGGVR